MVRLPGGKVMAQTTQHATAHVRFIGCAAVLGLLTALSGCGPKSVSGGYIAKGPDTVVWLQLVETPDKHITGQLNSTSIDKSGQLVYVTAPVAGAVDGETISLSFKRDALLASSVQLAGSVDGDTLHLRGGQAADEATFHRAKDDEFVAGKQALAEQSQRALAAKAEADQRVATARREKHELDEVRDVTQQVNRMNAGLPQRVEWLLTTAKTYPGITEKMRGLVHRQEELAGNPGAFVLRNQVVVNLNQNLVNSNQTHISVSLAARALDTDIKLVMDRLTPLTQSCHRAIVPGGAAGVGACQTLLAAAPEADRNAQAAARAIGQVEATYQRERSQQEELFRTAQRLQ